MGYRFAVFVCVAIGLCRSAEAQPAPPSAAPWFEPQAITLSARYRAVENSAGVVTNDQVQYKDVLRARFNFDRERRFGLNLGAFSGSSFISSWDTTGIGTGDPNHDIFVKQLYLSAIPATGVELQAGGLYINRGESTEITTYDDDGFLMGERVTLRRPDRTHFDELSFTRAAIGPASTPSVTARLDLFAHQNYWQAQAVKRFGPIGASADVTDAAGARTVRAAMSLRLPRSWPLTVVRVEEYRRVTVQPANGFAVVGERPLGRVRLQGGYADIDRDYGGLNADRLQRGRRVFAIAAIPIVRALTAQLFATRAFAAPYAISNRTRFDAVVTYDVLAALHDLRAGQQDRR